MSRAPTLSVVADNDLRTSAATEAPPETIAERVRRLQAESKALAKDHAQALSEALVATHALAAEIHSGGDAYAAGVRAIARDVMADCESRGLILATLLGRAQ